MDARIHVYSCQLLSTGNEEARADKSGLEVATGKTQSPPRSDECDGLWGKPGREFTERRWFVSTGQYPFLDMEMVKVLSILKFQEKITRHRNGRVHSSGKGGSSTKTSEQMVAKSHVSCLFVICNK
jgi:hypothetical protein